MPEDNMINSIIPEIVVGRLPQYLRSLQRMAREGRQVTSSQELGERLGVSAAQIRKDLSQFGEFGKQGTGYNIDSLINQLRQILHIDHDWNVAVVGIGELGNAISRYKGFANRGFQVTMIFDSDPEKIGKQVGQFFIQDSANMVEKIREAGVKIAMIAVPASEAQKVTDHLLQAGIRGILSYAPIIINVPPGIRVTYIDPSIFLQRMTYYIE
jgi:redox-sensing transcriptional repressor